VWVYFWVFYSIGLHVCFCASTMPVVWLGFRYCDTSSITLYPGLLWLFCVFYDSIWIFGLIFLF
jgi:hypothetical protein